VCQEWGSEIKVTLQLEPDTTPKDLSIAPIKHTINDAWIKEVVTELRVIDLCVPSQLRRAEKIPYTPFVRTRVLLNIRPHRL